MLYPARNVCIVVNMVQIGCFDPPPSRRIHNGDVQLIELVLGRTMTLARIAGSFVSETIATTTFHGVHWARRIVVSWGQRITQRQAVVKKLFGRLGIKIVLGGFIGVVFSIIFWCLNK